MRLLLLIWLMCVHTVGAATVWQPDERQITALREATDSRWNRLFNERGQMRTGQTSIELSALTLDAVVAGYPSGRIDILLQALSAMQDTDAESPTLGNFHWYQGAGRLVDRNGVQFVMRKTALIWLLYRDRLTEAQQAVLLRMLQLARDAVLRHTVRVTYTNIFLMKTWNVIALGEAMADAALARQGYAMLDEWLQHTSRTGVTEYLSPSYYDINLESLALIQRLSGDASARQMAQRGLDYLWAEILLNWYAPADRLGGPHSRDYNRLFNVGGLNEAVARSGIRGPASPAADPFDHYSRSAPSDALRALQTPLLPRYVSGRWGPLPEQRWHQFIGQRFSIGSSESTYPSGHDNAPLVINLGEGQNVPIINFFMDGRRDHYGQNRTPEASSGHLKSLHLRPFLASAQNRNDVLFIASIKADTTPDAVALESVVTLPADAQLWLDDQPLAVDAHTSAWRQDFAPNGVSTRIDVRASGTGPELWLSDADPQLGVGVSQVFPVQAGRGYRAGVALQGGEISLYLNFLDARHRLIGTERIRRVRGGPGPSGVHDFEATAPAGAVWCKVWLYSPSGARTEVRVTDLFFEETGPSPRRLGGFDFRVSQPARVPVTAGQTLFVRRGDAAAALRLLGAWDVADQPVGLTLHNDGLAYGALRLTAVHADSRSSGRGTVALWAHAAEGLADDAAFATFRQQIRSVSTEAARSGAVVSAAAGALRLRVDVERSQRLLREGMTDWPDGPLVWRDASGRIDSIRP